VESRDPGDPALAGPALLLSRAPLGARSRALLWPGQGCADGVRGALACQVQLTLSRCHWQGAAGGTSLH
jgi:hypothetical protein